MSLAEARYTEWKALFDYCCENREWLEQTGRMTALVLCLQRHWQAFENLHKEASQYTIGNRVGEASQVKQGNSMV